MTDRGGETAVAEEKHEGVDAFLVVDVKVPEHVCARYVCSWMSFVAPVQGWEFDRISYEEDGLV